MALTPPIIVCGVARSGTTFARDLIASHPEIAMSDEFFVYRFPSLMRFLEELESTWPQSEYRGELKDRKGDIMRALWFHTSSEPIRRRGVNSRRFGNKTPGAERYFDFYDRVFEASPPQYVYLLRRGMDVFVSRLNMPWQGQPSLQGQLKRYFRSISLMESFRRRHPGRLYILQLDRIGPSYEQRIQAVEKLFGFFGEEPGDQVRRFVDQWRPVQLGATLARGPLVTSLPDEDQELLAGHSEYQEVMQRYGY